MSDKVIELTQDLKTQKKENSLEELKSEFGKITWTPKSELLLCTKLIVGSTFFFGFAIYFVDLVVKGALDLLHALFLLAI